MKFFNLIILSTTIFCSQVIAAPNQSTGSVNIISFNNWNGAGNQSLYVQTDGAIKNPSFCTNTSRYFIDNNASDISRAMILGAKMNNQKVTFVIWGGGCSAGNFPVIVNVSLN